MADQAVKPALIHTEIGKEQQLFFPVKRSDLLFQPRADGQDLRAFRLGDLTNGMIIRIIV